MPKEDRSIEQFEDGPNSARITLVFKCRENYNNRSIFARFGLEKKKRSGANRRTEIIVVLIKRRPSIRKNTGSSSSHPFHRALKEKNKSKAKGGTCAGETSKSNIDSRLCARRASRDAGPPLLSDYSH